MNFHKFNPNRFFPDSFIEISHFYQGYIDNEINLNSEGNCRKSCDDYTIARHYHCADDTFCAGRENQWDTAKTICNGSVIKCQYMGGDLSFCLAVSDNFVSDSNRHHFKRSLSSRKTHSDGTISFGTITATCSVDKKIA